MKEDLRRLRFFLFTMKRGKSGWLRLINENKNDKEKGRTLGIIF